MTLNLLLTKIRTQYLSCLFITLNWKKKKTFKAKRNNIKLLLVDYFNRNRSK